MKELGFINFHGSRLRYVDRKEGNVPFITAGKENQGIIGTIGNEVKTYCDPITIDMFGNVFYHDGLLAGDDNVYFFVNQRIGKYEKMYIVSVIRAQLGTSFAYVDQFRQDDADALTIALPSKDNQPDFAYMEQYIRSLEQRVQTTLTSFEHLIQLPKHTVDTTQWKAYKIGDLFEVVKGKRLTKTNMKEGAINYIGATAFNNGITAQIANDDNLHQAGTITVCYNGSIGQAFYQNEPYWATDDVNVLYPKFEMSKYMALFIVPILKTLGQKYGYVDKWTQDKMKETEMALPTTSDGTPDFVYMEQYMQKIEQRVQQNNVSEGANLQALAVRLDRGGYLNS